MKQPTLINLFRNCSFRRTAGLSLLAATLVGMAGSTQAQTYSLTNLFSIPTGTGNIATGTGNRGLAYDSVSNLVYVAATTPSISAFDGTAGTLVGSFNVTGISAPGDTLHLDQIGVAGDGAIYGINLSSTTNQIYRWSSWNSGVPTIAFSGGALTNGGALGTSGRIGDTMTVTGSGTNTLILTGVGAKTLFSLFWTTNGTTFTNTIITVPTGIAIAPNVYGITFYTNNSFLVKPASSGADTAYLITYPANYQSQTVVTGTVVGSTTSLGTAYNNTTMLNYSAGTGLLAAVQTGTQPTPTAIFNATNILSGATLLASTNAPTANSDGNATGGAALGKVGTNTTIYALDTGNGLYAFKLLFTAAPAVPTITTQPSAVSGAYAPQTVTVTATGTAPLAYNWYINPTTNLVAGSSAIPGATNSSYTITTASTNYYFVIITNSAGSVTSSIVQIATIPATTNSVVTPILSIATGNANYSFLANDDNTRGLAYDPNTQRLVVANKNGGANLYILDANNGTNIGKLNTTGMITTGTFPVDQVVIAADGTVYSGNLMTSLGQNFVLTQWTSPTTNAVAYTSYNNDPTGGNGGRYGDTMTIRGTGVNTQIALPQNAGTNVVLLTTSDGSNFVSTICPISGVPAGFAMLGLAFGSGNTLWAKTYGSGSSIYLVTFDPTGATAGTVLYSYSQTPGSMVALGVDTNHNILGGVVLNDQNPDLQLFQITGNSNSPVLFDQAFFANYNASANGNKLGVVDMKYPRVYAMDVDLGIIGVTYGVPASTPPTIVTAPSGGTAYAINYPYTLSVSVSGTLPLNYQWQYNTVSNLATASNIPGATGASYTLNPPTTNATGWYDVIVTNFGGAVTSAPVLLTFIPPLTSPYVTNIWTLPPTSPLISDTTGYAVRGIAYDTNTGTVLLANRVNTTINVLNATNGSDDSANISINTYGLPPGTFTIDQIGVADDGKLYLGNLAITSLGDKFSLTQFSAVSSSAAEYVCYSNDPGNGSGDRWGDTMAIRGSGVNTQILLGSYGQGYGAGTNVALLTTTDGQNFTSLLIPVSGPPSGFAGAGIAFGAGNTFWAKGGHFYDLRQVSFDPTGATPAVVLQDYSAPTQTPNDFAGLGVDAANNLLFGTCLNDAPNDFQVYELTGTTNSPALISQTFYAAENANAQDSAAAVVKYPYAFGLDVNNGVVALQYSVPPGLITTINLTGTPSGSSLILNWNAVVGRMYQVQSTTTPQTSGTSWSNVGSLVTATNSTMSYTITPLSGAGKYYRVVGK